jgi:hypothetical protein
VKARKIRSVHVEATLLLRCENKLDLARLLHASRLRRRPDGSHQRSVWRFAPRLFGALPTATRRNAPLATQRVHAV